MDYKSKKLLNNTVLFLIGNIGSKFIQFILVPLYTYTLTTSQYGETEIVFTTINLLTPIFSLSISDGFLRFGLDKNNDKDEVTKITFNIICFGTILSIFCISIFKINEILSKWIILFIILLNLRIYRDILAIRLKIIDNNKLFTIDSILYTFILCIFSVIFLVYLELGIKGYFLAYIVANIISIFFICIYSKFKFKILFKKINKELMVRMVLYSLPMMVNGIAWWITNAIDRYMIQYYMTDSDVGIYSVAAKLPSLLTTFTGIFSQAWIISSVTEYDNDNDKGFYSNVFRKYYGILFLGCILMILFIKPFMYIYVSKEYYISWIYAPILIVSAVSSGIAAFTVGIYSASMKNINITITTIIGAVLNIVLNIILIPKNGIIGAAIATYISWTIIAVIRLIDISYFFEFKVEYKRLCIYFSLSLLQIIILLTQNFFISTINSIIILIIIIIMERKMLINILRKIFDTIRKVKKK